MYCLHNLGQFKYSAVLLRVQEVINLEVPEKTEIAQRTDTGFLSLHNDKIFRHLTLGILA